jgi:predicted tellurium resistance membrane protein TerC
MHIPRGYIYFAMGFSVTVEMLNLRLATRAARRWAIAVSPNVDLSIC